MLTLRANMQLPNWQDFKDDRIGKSRFRYYTEGVPPDWVIDLLPKPMFYAHHFWAWVWFLSIPGCIALAFIRWWLVFSVLIVPGTIRKAVRRSACEFVLEHAYKDEDFFNLCLEKGVIQVMERKECHNDGKGS